MGAVNLTIAALTTLLAAAPAGSACEHGRQGTCTQMVSADVALGSGQSAEVRLSKVVGTAALGEDGERLGIVGDVLVDGGGRTVAVVLRVGWFLGIPTRSVVVPSRFVRFEGASDGSGIASDGESKEASRSGKRDDTASIFDDLMQKAVTPSRSGAAIAPSMWRSR